MSSRKRPSWSSSSGIRRSPKKAKVLRSLLAAFGDDEVPASIIESIVQYFSGEASASVAHPPPSVAHPPPPSVADPPPSAFARRNTWKGYQFQEPPRFLAYRGPLGARPQIPLVLVHEAFSRFALDLESKDVELSEDDYAMADDVYAMFSEGFDDEVREMNEGKLSGLFELYLGAAVIRQLKSTKMDGLMIMSNTDQPMLIVFEDKTDDGPNGYFEGLEICRRVFYELPMKAHGILVLRACPYVIIIAVVMDRKENVLLSEPLAHIAFWGREDQTVLQGAKAMRALRNFSQSYVSQSNIDVSRPFPIATWQNVRPLNKSGMMFCGTFEGKSMVAKFTEHYSCEAHEAWHRKNLAPKLYDMKDLGSGWKFVTMEYLSEDAGWHSVAKDPPDDKLRDLLTAILEKGHETGYVHGDFRPPNLLINDDKVIQAIDFEWSGREGEAHYPTKLNPKVQWEPTARKGAKLRKIHDVWHVNNFNVDPRASTSRST